MLHLDRSDLSLGLEPEKSPHPPITPTLKEMTHYSQTISGLSFRMGLAEGFIRGNFCRAREVPDLAGR